MRKTAITAILLTALFSCASFAACTQSDGEVIRKNAYALSYYDGNYYDELDDADKPQFNTELWRRNDLSINGADPMILDDTERSGYYYAYVTGMTYYYSSDLESWTYGGSFLELPSDMGGSSALWAPEVIYDDGQYYCFFSLTPAADSTMEGSASVIYMPVLAVSDSADGPFTLVDFYAEGLREQSDEYPQYYAKYCLFDELAYQEAFIAEGLPYNTGSLTIFSVDGGYIDGGWVRSIDFHPFVDPDTGEKYLYWSQTPGAIAGVKMTDWYTPDWSTFTTLTACGYYTIEDYVMAQNGQSVDIVSYEEAASYCNEGPFMYKHNGKYYLTFSIGAYNESSYGVMQAVSDSPLGPFRKLTDSENGMILNNDLGDNYSVAGPGHHSFVTINSNGENKLLIAYHAHDNPKVYTDRHVQFDEVKWVTVTDINGDDLDVMHVNGPTVSVQPTFGIGKEYGDVSSAIEKAEVVRGELSEGSSADSLADGLVSYFTRVSKEFNDTYVKETEAVSETTFELTLSGSVELRGIMFYNSKSADTAFEKIKNIAFICEENGVEKIYLIEELEVNQNVNYVYDDLNEAYYIVYGAGCYVEFNAINVKSIRFTLEVPADQQSAAIAEVALVGKIN